MPSVYSSVFQNFIRQGFAKSLTHGYAQSVVAATHPHALNSQNRPTFARRSTARVGRLSALGLQSAFHNSAHHASLAEHRHEKLAGSGGGDVSAESLQAAGGQAADAAADEWVQFQFPKRIEWKPTPAAVLLGSEAKGLVGESEAAAAADEHGEPGVPPESEAALAHIDAALESAIEERKQLEALEDEVESLRALSPQLADQLDDEIRTRSRTPASVETPASISREPTPPVDPESQAVADQLAELAEHEKYNEIPVVFEAMLASGIQPIAASYNALLGAAIRLTAAKSDAVAKALDIYTDMRRRKVALDSDTYDILVGLLASRSLSVSSLKRSLERIRVRYGGMHEPGKFMFGSHELEYAILSEEDRLDLAVKLFDQSVEGAAARYSPGTYHELIAACGEANRLPDMLRLFEHMEANRIVPLAATFSAMITAFAQSGDLVSAVECYNEYRSLAIANDQGEDVILNRLDFNVYAAVIKAYVISDKPLGAERFFKKLTDEYGDGATQLRRDLIADGLVAGYLHLGIYHKALHWARLLDGPDKSAMASRIAVEAADKDVKPTALAAASEIPSPGPDLTSAAIALLAMSIREGDVVAASHYWAVLNSPSASPAPAFIEPTAMYAVAMIGSGQVVEGLMGAEHMFQRIRDEMAAQGRPLPADEIEEAAEFISRYMSTRNITDPRIPGLHSATPSPPSPPAPLTPPLDFMTDPYASTTDLRTSVRIAEDVDRFRDLRGALQRLTNLRKRGLHPKYNVYVKLIIAAAHQRKLDLCHEIMAMAQADVPLVPGFAIVRHGWSLILDAMLSACIINGDSTTAARLHQELLAMGSRPSANTYGHYITALNAPAKTLDEATEAVALFQRSQAEGVEPSPFLYNALISKLGKARRIDDCLFYFSDMRKRGIQPTSVTYGTVVNALCRVSDEKFAEELFDEMESMPNYKARPAPYNSIMQFFLSTKRDRTKLLKYYERLKRHGIAPSSHTFKLLIDAYATLPPVDMEAAEAVLDEIRAAGSLPESNHYASLIRARGCVLHDAPSARALFESVLKDAKVGPDSCLYQALFDALVANHQVAETDPFLDDMRRRGIALTPYIANTLIHGWATAKNIARAHEMYSALPPSKREPSTYEAMTRAFLTVGDRKSAKAIADEMHTKGYPAAVLNKVADLVNSEDGGGVLAPVPIHVSTPPK